MASKILLRQDQVEDPQRLTLLVLDELHQAGRLEGLADLLLTGRQFGVATVIGFQSRSSLCKRQMYTQEEASDIVEQCANRMIARVSDDTAQWASKSVIGEAVTQEATENSEGKLSWHPVQRQAVLPATLQHLAHLETDNVFEAICRSPVAGTWHVRQSGAKVFSALQIRGNANVPAYVERAANHQEEELLRWSPESARELQVPAQGHRRFVPRIVRTIK